MKKAPIILILICILIHTNVFSQKMFSLSGFVEDSLTGERLQGATIHEVTSDRGTVSNQYGFFSISLPSGKHRLRVSYVGFKPDEIEIELKADTLLTVSLLPGKLLQEVLVTGNRDYFFPSPGKHHLSLDQIKRMPFALGETDILKALHFFPGVNPGQEGLSGFSIRGGGPDQTQFLLDGLPVYNVNHAFGYFSAFNGDALQDVSLYVGGLPARYGGHLSSVLDITMREGNRKFLAGSFHLSPVAASAVVEGPIKKDKASFIVSFRRTWLDGLLSIGQLITGNNFSTGYNFYDLNAKINWEVNSYNRLFLSFYHSRDSRFAKWKENDSKKQNRFNFNWGNLSVSGRWNHLFNSSFFSNITLYYSQFSNNQKISTYNQSIAHQEESRINSRLKDWTLKTDLEYFMGEKHHLRFGTSFSIKYFAPEMSYIGSTRSDEQVKDSTTGYVYFAAAYIEDDWQIGRRWKLNAGIRFSWSDPRNARYHSWQPRLSLSFQPGEQTSMKASWSRTQQSIHLLINSSVGMNVDLWVPVTDRVKPSRSDLFSLGITHSFAIGWSFSVEGYFHKMNDVVRYQDGIRFLKDKNDSWQDYIDVGKGRAHGLEMMLEKNKGLLTGWISYSLSKSERKFDCINKGEWFPFDYDRRHKVNVVTNYRFPSSEKARFLKNISVNFTYASGNYISLGKQFYPAAPMPEGFPSDKDNWEFREYIEHPNNFRMPAYHHLDIAYTLENRKKRGSSWTFSIYNLYARKNPSIIYHKTGTSTRSWSLLPFMPSVTWNYKF